MKRFMLVATLTGALANGTDLKIRNSEKGKPVPFGRRYRLSDLQQTFAFRNSLFILAMWSTEISLGHSASQA